MQQHSIFRAARRRHGARLKAFTAIERRTPLPFERLFGGVFRRVRQSGDGTRLMRYVTLERRG